MKQFYKLGFLLGLVALISSFSYQNSLDEIVVAMKTGNAGTLSKYFDNYVDISLPDKSNSYSKSQASIIMKVFFSSNAVKTFDIKHKGENGGNQFCIGILQTRSGSYRTTIFLKQKGDRQYLQEIRVENASS